MAKTIGIGHQDFGKLIRNNYFYIDKTALIQEWWESGDEVTLIARPRRFGKTLNMSMIEYFFSLRYRGQGQLFQNFSIWKKEAYRKLQGQYPLISLSFANIKEQNFQMARKKICLMLSNLYSANNFLLEGTVLDEKERRFFHAVAADMDDAVATLALHQLSLYLSRYFRKKVIILLDEYDTPMQEAYVNGYWDELTAFLRSFFHSTFKTNPYLERAIMTGTTRVSKESIFSDLNNLKIITTTSEEYAASFGFTEQEVFDALDSQGLGAEKAGVRKWYDGFTFGSQHDIYNPWSILNFLDTKKYGAYWANTSSNQLISKLIQEGSSELKESFEDLLCGKTLQTSLEEQIVYNQLDGNQNAIWSLLLASGYLKVVSHKPYPINTPMAGQEKYSLCLTNLEVQLMFQRMVSGWFSCAESNYNHFIKALLKNDIDAMNEYLNGVALQTFSFFDTGKTPGTSNPERFYHGFVLGLIVELKERYRILSNRESGFGRYDVMLEPIEPKLPAILMEFKVFQPKKEKDLEAAAKSALKQIEQMDYAASLQANGIPAERIYTFGFAFYGKEVLILSGKPYAAIDTHGR